MCICNGLSPRLCAIEGSAVLTMVVSSDCIKKPKATMHNCQRVLSGRSVIYSVTACLGLREKRIRRRSKKRYTTGVVYSVRSWLMTRPPTMVIPNGCRNSEPSPPDNTSGSAPNSAARVVIIIGRKRSRQAWKIASCGVRLPCRWASSAKSTIIMAFFFTMPINNMIPISAIRLNGALNSSSANSAPTPAEGRVERIVSGCT